MLALHHRLCQQPTSTSPSSSRSPSDRLRSRTRASPSRHHPAGARTPDADLRHEQREPLIIHRFTPSSSCRSSGAAAAPCPSDPSRRADSRGSAPGARPSGSGSRYVRVRRPATRSRPARVVTTKEVTRGLTGQAVVGRGEAADDVARVELGEPSDGLERFPYRSTSGCRPGAGGRRVQHRDAAASSRRSRSPSASPQVRKAAPGCLPARAATRCVRGAGTGSPAGPSAT